MVYDWRKDPYIDPELKQFFADYETGTLDAKEQAQKRQNHLKNLRLDFQLMLINTRRRRKIIQAELAKELQVPQTFISKIENGNPRLSTLIKYGDALGCRLTLSDIINKTKQE